MDINNILDPSQLRIIKDYEINNFLGSVPETVKGPRKPKDMNNPCFTLNIPSNPINPDTKIYTGTLIINFYADNYGSGNANTELIGAILDRLVKLFDEWYPDISGYKIGDWTVREPLGPLWDSSDPDEHFGSIRIGFTIQETA